MIPHGTAVSDLLAMWTSEAEWILSLVHCGYHHRDYSHVLFATGCALRVLHCYAITRVKSQGPPSISRSRPRSHRAVHLWGAFLVPSGRGGPTRSPSQFQDKSFTQRLPFAALSIAVFRKPDPPLAIGFLLSTPWSFMRTRTSNLISWTRGHTKFEGDGEQAPRLLKKHWKETLPAFRDFSTVE